MSLTSNKKDRLIAQIVGGEFNGEKIYLNPDIHINSLKEFDAPEDGKIVPIINTELRDNLYVASQSGAGKSFFVAQWVKNAKKYYPDNKVYLISPIKDDKAYDKLNHYATDLEDLEQLSALAQLTPELLKDSFVIFDDTDTIKDKTVAKIVNDLRDTILSTGRHTDTKTVITSHLISNYDKTRLVLNEATDVVLYPKSGSRYGIRQYLKTYVGLEKSDIDKIMSLNNRWVYISKTYPVYCITESKIFLI